MFDEEANKIGTRCEKRKREENNKNERQKPEFIYIQVHEIIVEWNWKERKQ